MSTRLLNNTYLYRVKKPKKKKRNKISRIERYTKTLNNLPNSEVWLHSLWESILNRHDQYNSPLGCYIPDIINRKYKYIIEIDGSIHNNPDIVLHDKIKDEYYQSRLYTVFRIKAYDNNKFEQIKAEIIKIRQSKQ